MNKENKQLDNRGNRLKGEKEKLNGRKKNMGVEKTEE
jgi:hypothetical protein